MVEEFVNDFKANFNVCAGHIMHSVNIGFGACFGLEVFVHLSAKVKLYFLK